TWASTIQWIKDAGGDAPLEIDIYGGYKGQAGPVGYDVGFLTYQYPNHSLPISPVTNEIYAAGTFGPATLKYSHSVSNLFGFADSKNSGYLGLSANFDLGTGWSVTPHVGHQKVANNGAFSYTDYSLTSARTSATACRPVRQWSAPMPTRRCTSPPPASSPARPRWCWA